MSDAQDDDLLAAEYALGCLDAAQAEAAQRRVAEDPAFARAVEAWQHRLAPLSALVDPVTPPAAVWQRIEASIAPPAADNVVPLRRLRVWQGATAGALALAASLAAFLLLRPPAPPLLAVLAPVDGAAPVLLATREPGAALRIQPSGAVAVPDDRDLELWALPPGATKPRSLGVLPAGGRLVSADVAPETRLLVSLEPRGGSPTGQPTGPVLYAGRLTRLD
jgi:anti-sigma-K factor RskA